MADFAGNLGAHLASDLEIYRQSADQPIRRQRKTVSGWTMIRLSLSSRPPAREYTAEWCLLVSRGEPERTEPDLNRLELGATFSRGPQQVTFLADQILARLRKDDRGLALGVCWQGYLLPTALRQQMACQVGLVGPLLDYQHTAGALVVEPSRIGFIEPSDRRLAFKV